MLSLSQLFSLSSFNFIKRLSNSSSLSAIRVVSSAYLRLLIFLPAVLIPACVGLYRLACQGFLVREACVSVLVGGAVFLLSGVQ